MLKLEAPTTKQVKGKTWLNLEVPRHLVCQITGEIFSDPVMVSSGQTYERQAIITYIELKTEELLSKVEEQDENFDPS